MFGYSGGGRHYDDEQLAFSEYARREMCKVPLSKPVRYETKQFSGNRGLRVIFRKLGQSEKEHWLNHFAVAITSPILPPYNKPPWCNNCHTEVVMDIACGCTVRIGTMFKFAETNANGETVWLPGKLFISEISQVTQYKEPTQEVTRPRMQHNSGGDTSYISGGGSS